MELRTLAWRLVCFVTFSGSLLAQPSAEVADRAKQIFKNNCRACHYSKSEDGDPYEIFDSFKKSGMPLPGKAAKVLEAINSAAEAPGHMPPDRVLPKDELEAVGKWASDSAPPKLDSPSVKGCKVTENVGYSETHVTDAQAKEIFQRACVMCHGKVGELSSFEKGLGGVFAATAAIIGAKALRDALQARKAAQSAPQSSPTAGPGCSRGLANLANWGTKLTLAGTAGTILLVEAIKLPHTPFLHVDGSMDLAAFAKGDETLSRILNQIVGIDGHEFMPPRNVPRAVVGHYSDADKAKLSQWIRQKLQEDVPDGCEVTVVKHDGKASESNYDGAVSACDSRRMRVPSATQLQQMASQLSELFGGSGCVWSASTSSDPAMPIQIFSLAERALQPGGTGGSCNTLCIR